MTLGSQYASFNESLLFFRHKKAVDQVNGLDVYELGGARPLNVTNTDNRLIASALRLAIKPTLGGLITEDQRGFIGGRSMIANLVDVDDFCFRYAMFTF